MIYECYFNFDRKIHQDNLRKSLVSILIKTSENVSLRMLNDEIKSKGWFTLDRCDLDSIAILIFFSSLKPYKHKKQLEVLEIQHQSEMELLADIVTFIKDCFDLSNLPEILVHHNSNEIPVIADRCNLHTTYCNFGNIES